MTCDRRTSRPRELRATKLGAGATASIAALIAGCASTRGAYVASPSTPADPMKAAPASIELATPANDASSQGTAAQQGGAPAPATSTGTTGGETTSATATSSSFPVHGRLTSTYRGRSSGGDHDHDLVELLSIDVGDASKSGWTGHALARLNADLDGRAGGRNSPYYDLNDTYSGAFVPQLYDAYVERHDAGPFARVRVGRQSNWETPVFAWFDGASASTKPIGKRALQLGAYGGSPVHLYESSRRGDVMAGAFAEARPWTGNRSRLDWMHLEDGEGNATGHTNDVVRASTWQSFGKHLRADGWFTGVDGEERDVQARLTWNDVETQLTLSASWFQLLKTQRDLAPEIDPFFTTLFELFPYYQARLLASKGFGEHLNVQAGLDVRRVDDEDDVGRFNRDVDRAFTTVTVADVTPARVDLSVTGESWNGAGSDIRTWGLDVTKRFGDDVRASVGSYYQLYKVDSFSVEERDHVRTAYALLRWHRTKATTWDVRYEIEDADDDTFQTARVGFSWSF